MNTEEVKSKVKSKIMKKRQTNVNEKSKTNNMDIRRFLVSNKRGEFSFSNNFSLSPVTQTRC